MSEKRLTKHRMYLLFLEGKEGQEPATGQDRQQLDRFPQASLDNVVNKHLKKVHEHKSGRKECARPELTRVEQKPELGSYHFESIKEKHARTILHLWGNVSKEQVINCVTVCRHRLDMSSKRRLRKNWTSQTTMSLRKKMDAMCFHEIF